VRSAKIAITQAHTTPPQGNPAATTDPPVNFSMNPTLSKK